MDILYAACKGIVTSLFAALQLLILYGYCSKTVICWLRFTYICSNIESRIEYMIVPAILRIYWSQSVSDRRTVQSSVCKKKNMGQGAGNFGKLGETQENF